MKFFELLNALPEFEAELNKFRSGIPDIDWYPYGSLNNFHLLRNVVPIDAEVVPTKGSVIDVGAGDGDVGFLFDKFDCYVDFLDNPSTNYNSCRALKKTAQAFNCEGRVIEADIDFGFELDRQYDLGIFLGALYHLRNPALPLINLAQHCKTMWASTRVASRLLDGASIGQLPIAYLLERRELNNDPTNWWIMTPESFSRLLKRCGWKIISSFRSSVIGETNPVTAETDERMFVLCERVPNYFDLRKHHDF